MEFLCSSIYSSSWKDRTGSRTRYNISSHFVLSASRFFQLVYDCLTRTTDVALIYGRSMAAGIGTILSSRANLHDTIINGDCRLVYIVSWSKLTRVKDTARQTRRIATVRHYAGRVYGCEDAKEPSRFPRRHVDAIWKACYAR